MMKEMSKEFAPDNDFGNVAKDEASDQILPSTKNKANPQILLDSIAAVRQQHKGTELDVAGAKTHKQLMKKEEKKRERLALLEWAYEIAQKDSHRGVKIAPWLHKNTQQRRAAGQQPRTPS